MNIHIHHQRRDSTTALDEQMASAIQHALGHLAARVDEVTIHLRAAHGSHGDVHTHCRIVAAVPMSHIVIVESLHADEVQAVTHASRHLARAVQDQCAADKQPIATAPVTQRIAATALFRRRTSMAALTTGGQAKDTQSHHISA